MKSQTNALSAPRIEDDVNVLSEKYAAFDQIDGSHSFKQAVPNGFVDYPVRTRHGGTVFFFNFELAREMGLISRSHPNKMTPELEQKILHTFSIVIINEYDMIHKTPVHPRDIRPNKYMATRYLQLQHPNKQGKTSGDGRGIWNGEFKHRGVTWDVSSSGTGATCLSPAHAQTGKFFKTGDNKVGYGNGYNCLNDGLSAALMSDVFHRNGIDTEQTLAIVSFEGGYSINVRASKNLLRPAHFFNHLKQNNLEGLRRSIDYFINRQIANGDWPVNDKKASRSGSSADRYAVMAEQMALTFSRITAQYESEYIFCWLDWDGDNILANGQIIDYGSIRQFGLYHWEYRYDDVDRLSTNIPEQKAKARLIVQNFAQARHYLETGKKKPLAAFKNDPILKLFDQNFTRVLHTLLLKKLGLSEKQTAYVLEEANSLVKKFKNHHSYFEKAKSKRGVYKIADGVTADAVFCMAELHRELPKLLLKSESNTVDAKTFIQTMKSSFAKYRDLQINTYRAKEIKNFQKSYLAILKKVSEKFHGGNLKKTLLEVIMRASVTNQPARLTGDAVLHVTSSVIRNHHKLSFEQKHEVIEHLVQHQVEQSLPALEPESQTGKIVFRNIKAIRDYREGF